MQSPILHAIDTLLYSQTDPLIDCGIGLSKDSFYQLKDAIKQDYGHLSKKLSDIESRPPSYSGFPIFILQSLENDKILLQSCEELKNVIALENEIINSTN